MNYPVIKDASYILINTPDMVMHNGTTQTMEKLSNPDSEYLKKAPSHIRKYEEVLSYIPNQVYIGNLTPSDLVDKKLPWWKLESEKGKRFGKFGEIMPQDEFIGLLKISDSFNLVLLEENFTISVKDKLSSHPFLKNEVSKIKDGVDYSLIKKEIENNSAESLYNEGNIVGCVKKAHDVDINLTSHIMFENLVVKASGYLSLKHLVENSDTKVEDIEYVIECSEEACGDMNQRGGGNFAKSIAELSGAVNATGSDTRGFCAAPTHALIQAAALVQSGVYKNVAIVAGGATAKLGMNGKDHVKKDLPILEDVLGGFAVLVSENDGINPVVRTDLVGRHTVGTGSSPQAVITSLITKPLDKADMKITDIDKYSVEMQNPDVTKPAGAGDVPTSNYKMIAALGVKRGDIEKKDLLKFVKTHGMPGWAPTQGHIPSGVPYLGFAKDDLTIGKLNRAMIVGKGSLFLGRMTNLFDGVSVVIERNQGIKSEEKSVSKDEIKSMIAEAMKEFGNHLIKD